MQSPRSNSFSIHLLKGMPAIHWEGEVFTLTLWDVFFKEADRVGNQPEGRVSAEPDRGRTFF